MKLLYLVSFFAIGQGLFQILMLFKFSKERLASQILLCCIIALLSLSLLEYALIWANEIEIAPILIGFTTIAQFLFCPLIYSYFRVQRKKNVLDTSFFIQLIPFGVILVLLFPFYAMPARDKIQHLSEIVLYNFKVFSLEIPLCFIFILQCLVYFVLLKRKKEKNSYLLGKELFIVFSFYILTHIFHSILIYYFPNSLENLGTFVLLGSTFCIYLLSYYCYQRDRLIEEEKNPKYFHSTLENKKSKEIIQKFELLAGKEDYFTNAELRISNVASELKISQQHLSQAINQELNMSYRDYLNKLRIGFAKKLITDQKELKLSLKEIAFDSGFNNKTSFLNAFKKHMLMTPSEFVSQVKQR